jgi:hypothetical protein
VLGQEVRGIMKRIAVIVTAGLVLLAGAGVPAAADGVDSTLTPTSDSMVKSHFYEVQKRIYQLPAQTPWVTAIGGNEVLALGADSQFTGSPLLGGTETRYPIYRLDAATATLRSLGQVDVGPIVGPDSWVRMLDFQFIPELQVKGSTNASVILSFASYNAQTGCRRIYVNEALIDLTGAGQNSLKKRWFTLPCISPYTPTEGTWLVGPGLHQSGGRVALVPPNQWRSSKQPELYLTVGDFAMLANLGSQLPSETRKLVATLLKVTSGGSVSVVATGIRNAQGLTTAVLDSKASVVATTHGPRGGDELLSVRSGDYYGWPHESYGTVYDYTPTAVQSKPEVEGQLPTATKPAFSWLPSIGPSAVIQVKGAAFATWWGAVTGRPTGDLLVSGMASQQLYRVRWDAGAVRYVEDIPIGLRVRSLAQTPGGLIVAGVDTAGPDAGSIMVLSPLRTWSSATSSFG